MNASSSAVNTPKTSAAVSADRCSTACSRIWSTYSAPKWNATCAWACSLPPIEGRTVLAKLAQPSPMAWLIGGSSSISQEMNSPISFRVRNSDACFRNARAASWFSLQMEGRYESERGHIQRTEGGHRLQSTVKNSATPWLIRILPRLKILNAADRLKSRSRQRIIERLGGRT
jgi:hypothetical protein